MSASGPDWQSYHDLCFGTPSATIQMVSRAIQEGKQDPGGGQEFMDHLSALAQAILRSESDEKDFLQSLLDFIEEMRKLATEFSPEQLMAFLGMYTGIGGYQGVQLSDLLQALAAIMDGFRDLMGTVIEQFEQFPTSPFDAEQAAWPKIEAYVQSMAPYFYFISMYAPSFIEMKTADHLKRASDLEKAIEAVLDPENEQMKQKTEEEKRSLQQKLPSGRARSLVLRTNGSLLQAVHTKQQAALGIVKRLDGLQQFNRQAFLRRRIKPYYADELQRLRRSLLSSPAFTNLAQKDPAAKLEQIENQFPQEFRRKRELETLLERWPTIGGEELDALVRNVGGDPNLQLTQEDRLRFQVESWLLLISEMDETAQAFNQSFPGWMMPPIPIELEWPEEIIQSLSHTNMEGLKQIAAQYHIPLHTA